MNAQTSLVYYSQYNYNLLQAYNNMTYAFKNETYSAFYKLLQLTKLIAGITQRD